MALNPSPSQLSFQQIAQQTFDSTNDSVRMVLGSSTDLAISLDRTDQVTTFAANLSSTADITSASTGVLIAAADASGYKNVNLHVKTLTTIVGPQVLTLEYSPHDTDNVWIATTLTITPSLTANNIVTGTAITTLLARRFRVSTAGALTSGTAKLYLVAQG